MLTGVLGLLMVAGAACARSGEHGSPGTTSSPPATASLEGRTYVSTSITEAGAARALAGSQPIRLAFQHDRLTANPGCNTMGGSYRLDGEHLSVEQLATTTMACLDTALSDQDAWFAGLLTAGGTLVPSDNQLTFTSGDTVIVFVER